MTNNEVIVVVPRKIYESRIWKWFIKWRGYYYNDLVKNIRGLDLFGEPVNKIKRILIEELEKI